MLAENTNWRPLSEVTADTQELSTQFLSQQKALLTIKLLCRLSRSIQKHRGASIACLDGDIKFTPTVLSLQSQINKYLNVIDSHNKSGEAILDFATFANINTEWLTIYEGWQQDDVVHSYEFHCHLVERVRKSLRLVVSEYLHTPLSSTESDFRLEFESALIQLTDIIESLARLRGLATHTAVLKGEDITLHGRMLFLLKNTMRDSLNLHHVLQTMKSAAMQLSGLNHLGLQQTRIEALVDLIQEKIVDSDVVDVHADEIFEQATAIIDTYWYILDQALVATEDCIYQSFAEA